MSLMIQPWDVHKQVGKRNTRNGCSDYRGRHYLPWLAVWLTTFTTALIAAATNFLMVVVDVKLITWKFDAVQAVITDIGVGAGALTLAAFAILYSGVATSFVCLVAPICAGSGLPEAKGYLNGNPIKGMFQIQTFCVRVIGIIFSTGAGFPAGREGPMVCIGGFIGYRVVDCLRQITGLRKFFDLHVEEVDEYWFSEERRVGSTLGSAAGVATAFNAPIGGILYMLEEATVTSWAPATTFRALVCVAISIFVSRGLLNASGADFHRLVIFEPDSATSHISWHWIDVPFFVMLAAFVGSCSAGFTHVLIHVWKRRRDLDSRLARFQPYAKMISSMLFAGLCALLMATIPLAFDCEETPADAHHRRLGGAGGLVFMRYDCPDGKHNVLATLLLNTGEGAVKHLVARQGMMLSCGPLAVAVAVYGILAMGMPGLAVPMGNFIPAMVIGSLLGRFLGEGLHGIDSLQHLEVGQPGVYAMVGSAAMLGGFTHMTIAIVALMTEAGHDISLVPPLMLSIFVGHVCSHILNHVGYDERLILLKGVPFLEPRVPRELQGPEAVAKFICSEVPKEACLSEKSSTDKLQAALNSGDHQGFPVLGADGTCVGMVPRQRLATAMEGRAGSDPVHVANIMRAAPFRILDDMPATQFYPLFAKGVAALACVVNKDGGFCGLLSRYCIFGAISNRRCVRKRRRTVVSTRIRLSGVHEERHTTRVPDWVSWVTTLAVAVCVATLNYCMVHLDIKLITWKFDASQHVMSENGVGLGFMTLAAFSLLYSVVATCLVCFVAPICAGSGLPEAKGYLNGNPIPKMFAFPTFFVRVLGIIFSTAAGYPAGREGPMVCIGGFIGEKITHYLVSPWCRQWVQNGKLVEDESSESCGRLIFDEERFEEAKRVGAALGGVAGVSVAFNAPIGGILYMFEEASVTSWSEELTFRAFVIAACGSLVSRALLNATKADFHRLVIYEEEAQTTISWGWIDVPFFILVAAVVGLCAAGFTRVSISVWKLRRRLHGKLGQWQPVPKIAECLLYAVLCSACFALLPLGFDCVSDVQGAHDDGSNIGTSHRRLGAGGLEFVQHDCPSGKHSVLATLLMNSGEGTVKHLVSRSGSFLEVGPLVVALVVYGLLAMGMPGLAVPMGNFIPSMVLGALVGRVVGEALHGNESLHKDIANPGVYAMVGCAAMLSGFTHMSIAIVALLTEAGHDISLVSPIMLSIFVAHFFSKIGNHHGYDEVLILLKGVHYLDIQVPHYVTSTKLTALDLCTRVPVESQLRMSTTKSAMQMALTVNEAPVYPVLRGRSVLGLLPAARLKALAEDTEEEEGLITAVSRFGSVLTCPSAEDITCSRQTMGADFDLRGTLDTDITADPVDAARLTTLTKALKDTGSIHLGAFMNPAPFEIIEDMPADVTYALFARNVTTNACVISNTGELCGVLSRFNFMLDFMMARINEVLTEAEPALHAEDKTKVTEIGPPEWDFLQVSPSLPSLQLDSVDSLPEPDPPGKVSPTAPSPNQGPRKFAWQSQ